MEISFGVFAVLVGSIGVLGLFVVYLCGGTLGCRSGVWGRAFKWLTCGSFEKRAESAPAPPSKDEGRRTCGKMVHYLVAERNPIVQVRDDRRVGSVCVPARAELLLGQRAEVCELFFEYFFVWAELAGSLADCVALAGVSAFCGLFAVLAVVLFFVTCYSDPGFVTAGNVEDLFRCFPYDNVIYSEEKMCPVCKLPRTAQCVEVCVEAGPPLPVVQHMHRRVELPVFSAVPVCERGGSDVHGNQQHGGDWGVAGGPAAVGAGEAAGAGGAEQRDGVEQAAADCGGEKTGCVALGLYGIILGLFVFGFLAVQIVSMVTNRTTAEEGKMDRLKSLRRVAEYLLSLNGGRTAAAKEEEEDGEEEEKGKRGGEGEEERWAGWVSEGRRKELESDVGVALVNKYSKGVWENAMEVCLPLSLRERPPVFGKGSALNTWEEGEAGREGEKEERKEERKEEKSSMQRTEEMHSQSSTTARAASAEEEQPTTGRSRAKKAVQSRVWTGSARDRPPLPRGGAEKKEGRGSKAKRRGSESEGAEEREDGVGLGLGQGQGRERKRRKGTREREGEGSDGGEKEKKRKGNSSGGEVEKAGQKQRNWKKGAMRNEGRRRKREWRTQLCRTRCSSRAFPANSKMANALIEKFGKMEKK
ncbi:uncharacterized protein MONOS_17559 [Monocercomonoides exilis]|uniref:uncharacterized protein n=1 Tax=Monocercomonoides exilis TaxID=2049356 RepID=UPI00355AB7A6|nr:hypothetical protein MONOS_17559 [Monocercomonoides exilis]